jgi:hypothetical protein
MKQLYFIFAFAFILASSAIGQQGINKDNSQPGISSDQNIAQITASNSAGVPGNTVTSSDNTMTGEPNMVPGTIAANQSIAYNTAPKLLTATPPTGGSQPYSYQWQSSIDNNSFYNILGGTSLNYQPGALTVSTWYRQIQYSSVGGESVITNTISIHVYGYSVEDKATASQRAYPNPTVGSFILELHDATPSDQVTVDIYGLRGEKVITEVMNGERKHNFSLSGRPSGVYAIRVTTGDKTETVKIIKQ